MDQFQHRRAARTVAYIDLVLCSVAVILIVAGVVLGLLTTAAVVDELDKHPNSEVMKGMLLAMWILLIFGIILGSIEVWAAVMLLKATKQGAEASQALHRAKTWRMVASVFLAISLLYSLGNAAFAQLLFQLIIRGVMLFYVNLFIEELTVFVRNSGAQVP